MKIATICVSGVEAAALDRKSITMGLAGATVEFEYTDPMWSGLTKNVVFDGATTVAVYNAGTVVEVPSAVLAVKNTPLRVGVCGIGGDGSEVVPTIWAELGVVRSSAFGQFPPPAEVPLPVWAQVMALIGDLSKLTTDAKENLVAAINEAAASGGVDANTLQAAINAALAQAKASGEFDGEDGAPGKDGATYIPSVQDGYLSWRNEQGRPNPASSYIKGEPGKDGAPGKSAYQYAKEGGYTGTEEEFSKMLAQGTGGGGLPLPPAAAVGQFIVVSAVDESGKVTATEAVDAPTLPDAEEVAF